MNNTFLDDLKEWEVFGTKNDAALYKTIKQHTEKVKKDKAGNILMTTSSNPKSSKKDSSSHNESSSYNKSAGQKSNNTAKTKNSSTIKRSDDKEWDTLANRESKLEVVKEIESPRGRRNAVVEDPVSNSQERRLAKK